MEIERHAEEFLVAAPVIIDAAEMALGLRSANVRGQSFDANELLLGEERLAIIAAEGLWGGHGETNVPCP